MRVVIRAEAYADLKHISAWISNSSPANAQSVVSRILDAIDRLEKFPGMGHPGFVAGTREWVVRGLPYIIVYTLDREFADDSRPDLLQVIAIFHGAQSRESGTATK